MDFPLDTSPLVREHRSIAGVVEKWDLYVRGFELATGYSELVDPVIQRERFVEQAKLAARGDLEAMRLDEEFLRALEHGMPPIGRHGHGHRPAADGDHRPRHPRDDPLPAGQVAGDVPTTLLDGSVRLVELECFTDERGSLTPITLDDLGFSVARAFVVRAPRDAVRGGHAHRSVRQVLFCASGAIDVEVRRGGARARLTLDEEHPAVLLEAGVWAQQTYVGDDSTLIVFADGPYEPTEYAGDDSSTDVARSGATRARHEPTPGRGPRGRDHGLRGRDPARPTRIRRDASSTANSSRWRPRVAGTRGRSTWATSTARTPHSPRPSTC